MKLDNVRIYEITDIELDDDEVIVALMKALERNPRTTKKPFFTKKMKLSKMCEYDERHFSCTCDFRCSPKVITVIKYTKH